MNLAVSVHSVQKRKRYSTVLSVGTFTARVAITQRTIRRRGKATYAKNSHISHSRSPRSTSHSQCAIMSEYSFFRNARECIYGGSSTRNHVVTFIITLSTARSVGRNHTVFESTSYSPLLAKLKLLHVFRWSILSL